MNGRVRILQKFRSPVLPTILVAALSLAASGCGADEEAQGLLGAGDLCFDAATAISVNDPLAACQWPLVNTAQKAFSSSKGVAGWDINLLDADTAGYEGQGVKVAVSDSGLQIGHEDLSANVLSGSSRNYRGSSPTPPYTGDPSPVGTGGDHGTSVAGIIAAVRDNGVGGRGVASGAGIAGLNMLSANLITTAILLDQLDGDFDVFNQSWGSTTTVSSTIDPLYLAQLKSGVETLRAGKGAIYVKAAGNAFGQGINCNADPYNANPYTIVVGASNASGIASSYSSACSAIWITAPGGEYGDTSPAVVTTDVTGCTRGYAKAGASSAFERGGSVANSSCNYTHIFNGTSSATPHAAGVVALMLEANANLTWRDVKHILATTSRQIDASVPAVADNPYGIPEASGHVWETAWTTNAAGFKFHNWYGFGLIDAGAATAAAAAYSTVLGSWVDLLEIDGSWHYTSGALALAVPDSSAAGVTSQLAVAEDITIETVEIRISVTHPYIGDIGVELTSPSGTKSILFNVNHGFGSADNLTNQVLLSNAFYGESSLGNWTVKVIDGSASDTGTLTAWAINVGGHSATFSGF